MANKSYRLEGILIRFQHKTLRFFTNITICIVLRLCLRLLPNAHFGSYKKLWIRIRLKPFKAFELSSFYLVWITAFREHCSSNFFNLSPNNLIKRHEHIQELYLDMRMALLTKNPTRIDLTLLIVFIFIMSSVV